jgi:hypothetical protein
VNNKCSEPGRERGGVVNDFARIRRRGMKKLQRLRKGQFSKIKKFQDFFDFFEILNSFQFISADFDGNFVEDEVEKLQTERSLLRKLPVSHWAVGPVSLQCEFIADKNRKIPLKKS